MKNSSIIVYWSIAALTQLLVFGGCKPSPFIISDKNKDKVPENVFLLAHSSSSVTVAWDFINEATSYTVQLVSSPTDDYPLFTYTTTSQDYHEFNGLERTGSYYARVRANFPYSATSDWVYIMNGEQHARIVPPYGIVDEDFEIEYIKEIASSSSTITIEWSFTDFLEMDSEINHRFTLELFNDEAGEDLYISWENLSELFLPSTAAVPRPLRFTFSGLLPGRAYYARVTNHTINFQSTIKKIETKPFNFTEHSSPSAPGHVILAQDFSRFIHGGDILYKAAGYTVGSAAGRATWQLASGPNPVNTTLGQATCNITVEFNVFDGGNVTIAYTEGTGMKGWGKLGNTSTRPGHIKIGGASGEAILYTPTLSRLNNPTNVTVSFKAAVYSEGQNHFAEAIRVLLVENDTFDERGVRTAAGTTIETRIVDISDAIGDFVDYNVTFTNVSPNSRIAFGSQLPASANRTRFLLDEVVIRIAQ